MTIDPITWIVIYFGLSVIVSFFITSVLDIRGFAPSGWEITALAIFWVPIAWIVLIVGIIKIVLEFPRKFFPAIGSVTAKILEMFFERPVDKF